MARRTKITFIGTPKFSVENDPTSRKVRIRMWGESYDVNFSVDYDDAVALFRKFWTATPEHYQRRMSMPSGEEPFIMGDAEPITESRNGKNILFNVEGEEIWVPKKVIHDDSDVWKLGNDPGSLVVKYWWAEKHGHA